jgi:adenylylsulfate kinase
MVSSSLNIKKHTGFISKTDREKLHGHPGKVLWFTGFSASGKSTIAHMTEKILHERGCSTYVFDGDNVRHGLCSDLGFSSPDRTENLRRIGEMLHLFLDAGIISIAAFISPDKNDRQKLRTMLGADSFVEIFVDCPIETCIKRDPKGIYKKALRGEIQNFTGISAPYEPPDNPEIIVRSDSEPFEVAAGRIADFILSV